MDNDAAISSSKNIDDDVLVYSNVSTELMEMITLKNHLQKSKQGNNLEKLGGSLAVHCRADLTNRKVTEAASMATLFRGYESLLPGRDLHKVGMVSSTASGICGGVHATASALCLEMALDLQPPPLGIVLRNLLLSCQYLNDNSMHLFVLAGPDYSQHIIENTNPEIWQKAQQTHARFTSLHGFHCISDIMLALNKGEGSLYKEALKMVSLARQAYALLGGKYPHSESIIPGGVTIQVDAEKIIQFKALLQPFALYSAKAAAIWDDVFDFMLDANPQYENLGRSPASMLDFGQWDHPEYYDGRYQNCDIWGEKRWSTPAAIIDGKLMSTKLSHLNAGMEEFLDYSFQTLAPTDFDQLIKHDPKGNPISSFHPWNKRTLMSSSGNAKAYSWGSSLTWRGHGFEVGAYSRLYLTAIAQKIPSSTYVCATGSSLEFLLPTPNALDINLQWRVPSVWNAFERNRARAYALAFSLSVTLENIDIAERLLSAGETQTFVEQDVPTKGKQLGVGLWGASRGFLAHWAVLNNQRIDNYQIAIPSRINVGTRSPSREPGPLEKALINTPIIENKFTQPSEFSGIDIQRTIQSFDPCMSCTSHILVNGHNSQAVDNRTDITIDSVIDTGFPI